MQICNFRKNPPMLFLFSFYRLQVESLHQSGVKQQRGKKSREGQNEMNFWYLGPCNVLPCRQYWPGAFQPASYRMSTRWHKIDIFYSTLLFMTSAIVLAPRNPYSSGILFLYERHIWILSLNYILYNTIYLNIQMVTFYVIFSLWHKIIRQILFGRYNDDKR